MDIMRWGEMVLLTTPTAVEFSVWMGEGGWGHPISISVWSKGNIAFAVMNSATRSDSASEDMTNLMMVAMVRVVPLNVGMGSFYEINVWDPALLRVKLSFRYEFSECAAETVSRAL